MGRAGQNQGKIKADKVVFEVVTEEKIIETENVRN